MAWCLAAIGVVVVSFYLPSLAGKRPYIGLVAGLMQLTGSLSAMVLGPLIFLQVFRLIRGLQADITRRL